MNVQMFQYSVIIPAHNEASQLPAAIRSVLSQTIAPREIIVVDDGSIDDTTEVAQTFCNVILARNTSPMGPSAARNRGVAMASSEWIAFLDADDTWDPQKMEYQLAAAQRSGAGLVYCGVRISTTESGSVVEELPSQFSTHRRLCRALLLKNHITGSSSGVLVRRALLERAGGFDTSFIARASLYSLHFRRGI
ncbi:hypothetical protein LCGC14_2392980 [marine sediment metagenome]|uniref:Glycosyltransferase 2-like domain-containing protein n=1 Tax=marine sediment metagenome TaxID=412755 RepID=A0A0F9CJP1_9ZZZZ